MGWEDTGVGLQDLGMSPAVAWREGCPCHPLPASRKGRQMHKIQLLWTFEKHSLPHLGHIACVLFQFQ